MAARPAGRCEAWQLRHGQALRPLPLPRGLQEHLLHVLLEPRPHQEESDDDIDLAEEVEAATADTGDGKGRAKGFLRRTSAPALRTLRSSSTLARLIPKLSVSRKLLSAMVSTAATAAAAPAPRSLALHQCYGMRHAILF